MNAYADVFRAFGYPEEALAFAVGELPLPSPTLDVPFPASGFPPALVPIWIRVNDQAYHGFWQHFFCSRSTSVVLCSAEDSFRVVEYARTPEQLFARVCITLLSTWGGPTPQIRAFAAATGLDVDALDAVSAQVGDDPGELARFAPFRADPPLSLVRDAARYRGDFPHAGMPMTAEALRQVCTLELDPGLRRAVAAMQGAPAWLHSDDLPATFATLLDQGDHLGAWMALNSAGWTLDEAEHALRALAASAADPRLALLADAWTAQPRTRSTGY